MSNHLVVVNRNNKVVEVHACFCPDQQRKQFDESCAKHSKGAPYSDSGFEKGYTSFSNGFTICVVNV